MTLLARFCRLGFRAARPDGCMCRGAARKPQPAELEGDWVFSQYVVMLSRVDGDSALQSCLKQGGSALGALRHQDLHSKGWLEALAAEKELSHTPLTQRNLSFCGTSRGPLRL